MSGKHVGIERFRRGKAPSTAPPNARTAAARKARFRAKAAPMPPGTGDKELLNRRAGRFERGA